MCSIYSNHNSIRTHPQSALWSPWLTQRLTLFPLLLICRSDNKPRTICHCTIEAVLRRGASSESLACFSYTTPHYSPSSMSPQSWAAPQHFQVTEASSRPKHREDVLNLWRELECKAEGFTPHSGNF